MTTTVAIALGAALGIFVAVPLIGVGAAFAADRICDWHLRRLGR